MSQSVPGIKINHQKHISNLYKRHKDHLRKTPSNPLLKKIPILFEKIDKIHFLLTQNRLLRVVWSHKLLRMWSHAMKRAFPIFHKRAKRKNLARFLIERAACAFCSFQLQRYAWNLLFLRYILRKCLRFLQYFHFYVSYDPNFFLTDNVDFGDCFQYVKHTCSMLFRWAGGFWNESFHQQRSEGQNFWHPQNPYWTPIFKVLLRLLQYFHFYVSYVPDFITHG